MTTTIDELVVTLRLDPSQFTDGQKKALDEFKKTDEEMQKRLKNLEAANKNAGYSFENITNAAEGLFTVIAGAGMASFARDTMTSVAATGRLAHNIGESAQELSAFGRAVERNGGNADAAMGSMKGLSDQITRLNTLGQGSPELFNFLGTIGGQQGDSPLTTIMRFAEWAEQHKDNPQLVNLIGTQGGLDPGTINEVMKGRVQVLKDLAEAQKVATSPEQTANITRLQNAWIGLDQTLNKTGTDIEANVAPAISSAMNAVSGWIERNQRLADTLGTVAGAITALSAIKPALWVLRLLGLANPTTAAVAVSAGVAGAIASSIPQSTVQSWDQAYPLLGKIDSFFGLVGQGNASSGGATSSEHGAFANQAQKEAYIRAVASDLGIDPNIAMAVARSEGFNSFSGDNGTSFGAFQLHLTPGGRGGAVGDQFKSLMHLDPSDPANEHESIMFALEWAKRHGWHDFHGAANSGIGDRQGLGDINVTVQTTSQNPREHGRIVADEVQRRTSAIATQANTGLN